MMFVKGTLIKDLFDREVEFFPEGNNVVAYVPNTTLLIPGHRYRVTFGGVEHELVAKKVNNDDTCLMFDTVEIRDCYAENDLRITISDCPEASPTVLKIQAVKHSAPKINPDYLPAGGSGGILADLRFRVNATVIPNSSALEISTEVLRGDFATAVEKLQNGELLSANVEIKVTDSSGETFSIYEQSTAMYKEDGCSEIQIVIHEQAYSGGCICFCDDNTAFSENDNV